MLKLRNTAGKTTSLAVLHCLHPSIAECEALGLFLQVCRVGHKNDRPDVRVAVKTLIRSHRNFDEKALKHEIHIMQVVCSLHCIVMIKADTTP